LWPGAKPLPEPKTLRLIGLQPGFPTLARRLSNPLIPVPNGALTQENLNVTIGLAMCMKIKTKLRRNSIAPAMLMKINELIDFRGEAVMLLKGKLVVAFLTTWQQKCTPK
jgi:hypothetical protein